MTATTAQLANRLELEIDRAHWAAVDALKAAGAPFTAADVDRERTAREDSIIAAADRDSLAALWATYAKSWCYGAGERLKRRLAAELSRRREAAA